jgi:hypothetical protein
MAQNERARSVEEEITARRELEKGYQPRIKLGGSLWRARQVFLRSAEPFLVADGDEKEESSKLTPEEKFRADLDHLLFNACQEYQRAGGIPLDWDSLEREIAERRGGIREED